MGTICMEIPFASKGTISIKNLMTVGMLLLQHAYFLFQKQRAIQLNECHCKIIKIY
jgi:hypothetical protein